MGAGDDEGDGGLDDALGDAGVSTNSTPPPLSLAARMQPIEHELQRCTLENGLDDDDDDNHDESTGEDDLNWWCRHQMLSYLTRARLAKLNLATAALSAASERVFIAAGVVTKKHDNLGDEEVDAVVFLDGAHGLAWSSGISQEAFGRKDKQ